MGQSPNEGQSPGSDAIQPAGRSHRLTPGGIAVATNAARLTLLMVKLMNQRGDFVFAVVEDDGENVTIEVSEEDYQREREAGVEMESLLKPGRYKLKRGGFIARHPPALQRLAKQE